MVQRSNAASGERVAEGTPAEVVIRDEARRPETDPTLGIPVATRRSGEPKHRLVTLGDSLTQGFQSGAIFNTQLSWPRIVAWEMGWDDAMRYPTYWGRGGMPLNLEHLARALERRLGPTLDGAREKVLAGIEALNFVSDVGSHWKREWNQDLSTEIHHNLAVWGWDLRDVLARTADTCAADVERHRDDYFKTANARSGYRVLASARDAGKALTALEAARHLSQDGRDEDGNGIETLVVMLGSNNALATVVDLRVAWSDDGYDDLRRKKDFTVWRPSHFRRELEEVVRELESVRARHVVLATVPHVTIPPVSRGVSRTGGKIEPRSRYFEFYTRPWISDAQFDPRDDRRITAAEARAVDSAIDAYNDAIAAVVRSKRAAGHDWYLLELAGLLDRLAARRYIEDPAARPSWWEAVGGEYPLPPALAAVQPKLTSHFFTRGSQHAQRGGLFSLDGLHPTTVGYGILAQEVIHVMQRAGVSFRYGNGVERTGPIEVDFARLLQRDTLLAAPPSSIADSLGLLSAIDQTLDDVLGKIGLHARFP